MSLPESPPPIPETTRYQASIEVPAGLAEAVADALEAAHNPEALAVSMFERGAGGFEVTAHYSDAPNVPDIAALIQHLVDAADLARLRIEPLPDEDWVTLSQGQRGRVRAGRFLVHGRHERDRYRGSIFAIEIDAGQAFGTAHHASTQGCLIALDDLLKRRRFTHVVDIGTGSGVLAIAAARVLRRRVLASDADRVAVKVAAENALKNGVAPLLRAVTAKGFDHATLRRLKADLIFANLLEHPLLELAPMVAKRLKPAGIAVLSGITNQQSAGVEARYRALGFCLKRRIVREGWTSLVLVRRSSRKFQSNH